MTTNPFLNALAAALYIVGIVLFIQYAVMVIFPKDTIIIPMAMLSLFVFSAATMAYIVLYQPVIMFLEGKKTEATSLFLKTVACLGGFLLLLLAVQVLFFR